VPVLAEPQRSSLTDEQLRQMLHLRAMEWSSWPGFLSVPLVPLLALWLPLWWVAGAVIGLNVLWCLVRMRLVSFSAADRACVFVAFVKWPARLIGVGGLLYHRRFLEAALVVIWPLFAVIGVPGGVGRIEVAMAEQIGYIKEPEGAPTENA
jgi:hypothetical protein